MLRSGTVSDAAEAFATIIIKARDCYIPSTVPVVARPTVWWNRFCQRTYQRKVQCWAKRDWPGYHAAVSAAKKAQAITFRHHRNSLLSKLQIGSNDRLWWNLTKRISGFCRPHARFAPDVDSLATYFAKKLFLPKDFDCTSPTLPPEVSTVIFKKSWRIKLS